MTRASSLQFEYHCIAEYLEHHLRKDNDSAAYVAHVSQFSEDLLRECGCIATTTTTATSDNGLSELRKKRVLNNGYVDYGVDAIAKHSDGLCTALQMKMYTKKCLCASDLGTFMSGWPIRTR
jgi:hypothetical protein